MVFSDIDVFQGLVGHVLTRLPDVYLFQRVSIEDDELISQR